MADSNFPNQNIHIDDPVFRGAGHEAQHGGTWHSGVQSNDPGGAQDPIGEEIPSLGLHPSDPMPGDTPDNPSFTMIHYRMPNDEPASPYNVGGKNPYPDKGQSAGAASNNPGDVIKSNYDGARSGYEERPGYSNPGGDFTIQPRANVGSAKDKVGGFDSENVNIGPAIGFHQSAETHAPNGRNIPGKVTVSPGSEFNQAELNTDSDQAAERGKQAPVADLDSYVSKNTATMRKQMSR